MLSALNRWFEQNRWAGDAVFASVLLVVLVLLSYGSYRASPLATVILVLPLYARRTYPQPVLLVTVTLCLVQLVGLREPIPGDVVVPIVVYGAAAYIPNRRWGHFALIAGIIGAGLAVLASFRWYFSVGLEGGYRGFGDLAQALMLFLACVAVVVVAYLLGVRQRDRHERAAEQVAALTERNRLLTAERDTRVEMDAAAERARIARELHDIVAHSLSVIVVQADGGAAAARARPGVGPHVLETIAATSRDALAQMRRMVSILRSGAGSDNPDYAPAPGPADLDDLVAQVRSAGLPVQFDTIGTPREMTEDAGLTVYRVVQESLTNVLKHAGPAASCQVVLHYGSGEVIVTVTDDGRGAAAARAGSEAPGGRTLDCHETPDHGTPETDRLPGFAASGVDGTPGPGPQAGIGFGGHGLEGMRERVGLHGGSVHAAPKIGGGFEVTATIPYRDPPAP